MCLTWRFMVMKNSTKKYSNKMGQKTGTSKIGKNVAIMPKKNDLAAEYLHQLPGRSKQHYSLKNLNGSGWERMTVFSPTSTCSPEKLNVPFHPFAPSLCAGDSVSNEHTLHGGQRELTKT